MIRVISILFFLFNSNVGLAALSLDATRYIFLENDGSISGQVTNNSEFEYGAQIWIDKMGESDSTPDFIVTPSFFRISDGAEQIFRILRVNEDIPKNRESIYWLNLQEVPPANSGSGLSLAIRTKVKLIFRPNDIQSQRQNAETRIRYFEDQDGTWIVNETPFVFAISEVFDSNGKSIDIPENERRKLRIFKPNDVVKTSGKIVSSVNALNDYGKVEQYVISK